MKTPPHPALTVAAAHAQHRRAMLWARRPASPVGLLRAAGEKVVVGVYAKRTPDWPGADPENGTAAWRWAPASATTGLPDRHMIGVFSGLRFAADGDALACPPGADPATDWRVRAKGLYAAFARAVIRHEVGHARFTERDRAKLLAAVKAADPRPPHRLINLFEDVRIEAAERLDRGAFGWPKWQRIPAETADPRTWVWATKSAEIGLGAKRGAKAVTWSGADRTALGASAVGTLSNLFCTAQARHSDPDGTVAMVALAAEFMRHFPETADSPWPGDAGDPGDTVGGESDGRSEPAPAPEGASTPGPAPKDGRTPPTPTPEKPAGRIVSEKPGSYHRAPGAGDEWAPCPDVDRAWEPGRGENPGEYVLRGLGPPDADLIRVLVGRLSRIVHAVADRPAAVSEEGSRVYVPAIAGGDPACWLRMAPLPGKPTLTLVVDMSASMHSLWHGDHGREVVLAFRELARMGRIDLACWLTGGANACRLPVRAPGSVWAGLSPSHGVESFPETLRVASADLQRSRLAVCFTDGCLTDGSIDVRGWRARGVDLVGTVVAPTRNHLRMVEMLGANFGRVVVDSTAAGLASQLAVALSRRR